MRSDMKPRKTTSWMSLLLLIILAGIGSWYTVFTARGIELAYAETAQQEEKTRAQSTKKIDLGGDKPIILASLTQLTNNNSWMYVSKSAPLAPGYKPVNLTVVTLPRADVGQDMKLRVDVHKRLTSLFATATNDGYDLMISSAYRSVSDQQTLYDNMRRTNGEAYAKTYVLDPGASEHHTGYSLDLTDASSACRQDSDDCMLSPATAAWIADNAHTFGFIVRYPSGKESITGISHEPWHIRYVGVVLATQLYETDTTLDEFIEEVAPGRLSRQ